MSDYFALLGEPRRPWLDPDLLHKKFLKVSAEVHPDRVHCRSETEKRAAQERFAELNRAYNRLRHPKERLQHLLELETGAKPQQVQQVTPELMRFFGQAGELLKQTDAFLAQKAKTSSPLLQVEQFETGQLWTERLQGLKQELNSRQQELLAELKTTDAVWADEGKSGTPGRAENLRRLEQLYQWFSYLTRWEGQIQERIVALAL